MSFQKKLKHNLEEPKSLLESLTIAGGVLLPGETPSGGRGGLGSMNKDQLERWIKENGITGAGADKIRNKWKNLGPNLPLAKNKTNLKIKNT